LSSWWRRLVAVDSRLMVNSADAPIAGIFVTFATERNRALRLCCGRVESFSLIYVHNPSSTVRSSLAAGFKLTQGSALNQGFIFYLSEFLLVLETQAVSEKVST
jgi:hypothetical protein